MRKIIGIGETILDIIFKRTTDQSLTGRFCIQYDGQSGTFGNTRSLHNGIRTRSGREQYLVIYARK